MKLIASNFRGIKSVEINTAPITLLVGKNHSGKTSCIQAFAAALTGLLIPVEGLTKTHAVKLINDEAAGEPSVVTLSDASGGVTVEYPACTRSASGAGIPEISEYAAGIKSLVDIKTKERGEVVTNLLHAYPTRHDLTVELNRIDIMDAAIIDRIWKTIETHGWDAAADNYRDSNKTLKGRWEQITGEAFGAVKSTDWTPKTWESDLVSATEQNLTGELKQERDFLEVAISHKAVGEAEITALKNISGNTPELSHIEGILAEEIKGLKKTYDTIEAALKKLPPATQPTTQSCPKCGTALTMDNGILSAPVILTPGELQLRANNIAECQESLKKIQAEGKLKQDEIITVRSQLITCDAALKKLAEYQKTGTATGTDTTDKTADCRARVTRAQARLTAFTQKQQADEINKQIKNQDSVVAVLAQDGLRLTFLKTRLVEFNDTLASIVTVAAWDEILLQENMQISYGGMPYLLLSESEKFRVRIGLQVAIAKLENAAVVLIDGADILDSYGRNGLFNMLRRIGIAGIVAMTINKPEQLPDPATFPGVIYWIEDGTARKV